ncbi:hypothetical protein L195_g047734, partial [Trifolium pratense]
RRAIEKEVWLSLPDQEKAVFELQATPQKKAITVFEEQYWALHDIDDEWVNLSSDKRQRFMSDAEEYLDDSEVAMQGNNKRRVLVEDM